MIKVIMLCYNKNKLPKFLEANNINKHQLQYIRKTPTRMGLIHRGIDLTPQGN